MKKLIAIALLSATAYAKINLADVMMGTAITVNLLQIKDAIKAGKTVGKVTKRVARKMTRR